MSVHVVIIGGGVGGLCLAQGLRKSGVSVAVYERSRTPVEWLDGYRVHINPAGARALHDCLPPSGWDMFVGTVGKPERGFGFLTEQLKELLFLDWSPQILGATDAFQSHHSVSRITLRQVLLSGLDDVVHFGKEFVRYDPAPAGQVTASFADGTQSDPCDVLVAADGSNSRVRQQYLPNARRVDTGVLSIGGKLPLNDQTRKMLPEAFYARMNTIMPPRDYFMFISGWQREHSKLEIAAGLKHAGESAPSAPTGLLHDDLQDYVFWAIAAKREKYPDRGDLSAANGGKLQAIAQEMMRGWHPDLLRLVAQSDPSTVATVKIRTMAPVPPWQASNVTLIGDAIHNMTPMAGIGANTALRDASLLSEKLTAADRHELPLLTAIGEYEKQMRDYGFAAVRRSLQRTKQATSSAAFSRAVSKRMLSVISNVSPIRNKMARQMGT